MGAAEISSLAKGFQDYGIYFVAIVLGAACIVLWRRTNAIQDARLADAEKHRIELTGLLTKSIENDKDQTHALLSLTEVIKGRANV